MSKILVLIASPVIVSNIFRAIDRELNHNKSYRYPIFSNFSTNAFSLLHIFFFEKLNEEKKDLNIEQKANQTSFAFEYCSMNNDKRWDDDDDDDGNDDGAE